MLRRSKSEAAHVEAAEIQDLDECIAAALCRFQCIIVGSHKADNRSCVASGTAYAEPYIRCRGGFDRGVPLGLYNVVVPVLEKIHLSRPQQLPAHAALGTVPPA
jgi:hypothetical protein